MKIYNTLTRKKEDFVPITPGEVKMYVCGPTVYNFITIGNARPICVFDTLRRYLEYKGYRVTLVQNFTDIDDKIIQKAGAEGLDFKEISERYIAEYQTDAAGLGVRPATIAPKATETIDEILAIISEIIDHGYAYEKNGDVYFRAKKFKEYGKLSHMPIEELNAGTRIEVGEQKEDPMDFALWKAAKPGEPFWPSPWGNGRPGWHIECTAMIRKYLGESIDIHCGGQDLIFPHHENEIAQGECCTEKEYARYWMHNGYINVGGQKMSKSKGNFFLTRDVAEVYGYETIKLLMIQSHYRSPFNYTEEVVEAAQNTLERLHNCREKLAFALKNPAPAPAQDDPHFEKAADLAKEKFESAMDDDLNTADGLTALFDLTREINTALKIPRCEALLRKMAAQFDQIADILGLLYTRKEESLDEEVEALIAQRQQARKDKDFATADAIRDKLASMGILLKDTPQGVQWSKSE